jgi:hypothetical protein
VLAEQGRIGWPTAQAFLLAQWFQQWRESAAPAA